MLCWTAIVTSGLGRASEWVQFRTDMPECQLQGLCLPSHLLSLPLFLPDHFLLKVLLGFLGWFSVFFLNRAHCVALGWPETCYTEQTGLQFKDPSAFASLVLGLKTRTTTTPGIFFFCQNHTIHPNLGWPQMNDSPASAKYWDYKAFTIPFGLVRCLYFLGQGLSLWPQLASDLQFSWLWFADLEFQACATSPSLETFWLLFVCLWNLLIL